MNVNFLGEAILERTRGCTPPRAISRQASHWPEIEVVSVKISTLYSQISPLAREHTVAILVRPPGTPLSAPPPARDSPAPTAQRSQVRLSRHGGIPRQGSHRRGLHAHAGSSRPRNRPRRHRLAELTFPIPSAPCAQIQQWARSRVAPAAARITVRIVKGANMESERVEASLRGWPQAPFQHQARNGCQLQAHAPRGHEAGKSRRRATSASPRTICSISLTALCWRTKPRRVRPACSSKCSKAWPITSAARSLSSPATCCSTRPPAKRRISSTPSATSSAASMKIPARKIFCATPSKSGRQPRMAATRTRLPRCVRRHRQLSATRPRRTQNRTHPGLANSLARAIPGKIHQRAGYRFRPAAKRRMGAANHRPMAAALRRQGPANPAGHRRRRKFCRCADPSAIASIPRVPASWLAVTARRPPITSPAPWNAPRTIPTAGAPISRSNGSKSSAASRRNCARARADLIGAALGQRRQDLAGIRSRSLRSRGLRGILPRLPPRWWQEMPTLQRARQGRRCRRFAVEFSHRDSLRRRGGGARCRQHRHSQARLRYRARRVGTVPVFLARAAFRKRRCNLSPAPARRKAASSSTTQGRCRHSHWRHRNRPRMLAKIRACISSPKPAARTPPSSPRLADRDQAIKHVLHSAFSHAGQKCSATSLLLLEAEVYDDPAFRQRLSAKRCKACTSVPLGNSTTKMGPLIRPPSGDLETALNTLEPGEEWAVMPPHPVGGNPNLWTPGVKYGVRPGSFTHLTEFFGPVLGVMRFDETQRSRRAREPDRLRTHFRPRKSRRTREWEYWREHIHAGNLYINRVTTGAVVLRQPFGGMGKSVFRSRHESRRPKLRRAIHTLR